MRKLFLLLTVVLSCALGLSALAADGPSPTEKPGPKKSGFYDFWNISDQFAGGIGTIGNTSCTVGAASQPSVYGGNMLLDCDGEIPHNETTIAVDPNDARHAVGGYHSYLLNFNGATVVAHIVGSTSVTFDGGQSWREVIPSITPYQFTGDPALAFDGNSRIYFANIADHEGPGGNFTGPSVVVTHSDDGGLTWSPYATVARGQTALTKGKTQGPNVFNDKDYVAADAGAASPFRNRVYVSWSRFAEFFSPNAAFFNVPIFLSSSDDGQHWTDGRAISGFSPFCNAALFGQPFECDLNQDSYPAVAPNGRVYVSFENFNTFGLNQILVVSSADGGATWSAPSQVGFVQDLNFPQNSDGLDTLTGCALRYGVKANTATDPSDPSGRTVYVVWADNRDGTAAATNTDVFLGKSTDGGQTWTTIPVDTSVNDQFYPWVAVANDETVSVGYMDRSLADTANPGRQDQCKYGFAVTKLDAGGIVLGKTEVDSGISNPGNSRWFGVNSRFIGDYNGLAVGPDGATWSLWTDQRAPVAGSTRTGQHAVGDKQP